MSDLPEILDSANHKVNSKSVSPNCLIWADDIILLSEDEDGLNFTLKAMEEYYNENKLLLNTDKTKSMIFNRTGALL